jgi:ABC-type bacteriocin/lantibiotic exporter with double-glycine peptidase domain
MDAYKWMYGALCQQPSSKGLPATAFVLAAISSESLLASQHAVLLGKVVDGIGDGANDKTAWPLFGLIVILLVGKEACTISRKFLVECQSTSLEKGAFLEQVKHLLAVRVDALQDRHVGDTQI